MEAKACGPVKSMDFREFSGPQRVLNPPPSPSLHCKEKSSRPPPSQTNS